MSSAHYQILHDTTTPITAIRHLCRWPSNWRTCGRATAPDSAATNAWISVYCPRQDWVDFDPTNNLLPALEHISLAWGRDFADVSPLRGVILGGGHHDPEVQVTVLPLAAVVV